MNAKEQIEIARPLIIAAMENCRDGNNRVTSCSIPKVVEEATLESLFKEEYSDWYAEFEATTKKTIVETEGPWFCSMFFYNNP